MCLNLNPFGPLGHPHDFGCCVAAQDLWLLFTVKYHWLAPLFLFPLIGHYFRLLPAA